MTQMAASEADGLMGNPAKSTANFGERHTTDEGKLGSSESKDTG
jgi:hypothetical protein